MSHIPVLLKEVINLLDPKEGEIIIDGTMGAGGHAKEILKHISKGGKLILIDWDKEAMAVIKKEFGEDRRIVFLNTNYANLPELISKKQLPRSNGLLLDLGVSSDQLEGRNRGFSFSKDEPLLMTYSEDSEPLYSFLKRTNVAELIEIIKKFGEERYAESIAKAIFAKRHQLVASKQLGEIICRAVPKSYEHGRIHPATRTFQALRIYLNKELDNLEKILKSLDQILAPGGRVVIISFHSLEDRIVKNNFRILAEKGRLKIITKKPIIASPEEIVRNPRSRSAKLRAAIVT